MAEEDGRQSIELEILLTEYKARRDEILMLAERYGRFMMLEISLTSVIILVGRLVAGNVSIISGVVSGTTIPWVPSLVLVAVPLLSFYILASAMDSIHIIQLNGLRCGEIEKAINRIAGKTLLVWETAIIPELLWNRPFRGKFFWFHPNLLQGIFLAILMGLAAVLLTALAKDFMSPRYFCAYAVFLWLGLAFLIQQWIMLIAPARKEMAEKIERISASYLSEKEGRGGGSTDADGARGQV